MKPRRILHEKAQRFLRGWRECTRTFHVNLQSKWRPGAFCMRKHNDFFAVGGALRRGCILIRNRDSCSFNLHTWGMGLGWGGGVMLTFNWSRTPTWCYAQLLHLHKRCHVGKLCKQYRPEMVGFFPFLFGPESFFYRRRPEWKRKQLPNLHQIRRKQGCTFGTANFRWGWFNETRRNKTHLQIRGFPSKLVVSTNPFGKT